MENELIDRSDIQDRLNELINNNSRVNILFSNSGFGKTSVIETLLEEDQQTNDSIYIKVNTSNIMENVACEYSFIEKILNSIKERVYYLPYSKFESIEKFEKIKSSLSLTLNVGIFGVGVSIPKEYNVYINKIIEIISDINTKINIHIESLEKLDSKSLRYMIQMAKSTDNIMFFLECSNDYDKCQSIYENFTYQLINTDLIILDKLDWNYVSKILSDLNLRNDEKIKDEYNRLQGNIKRLIFNSKFQIKKTVALNLESKLLLDFINISNSYLTINEIREIITKYDSSNKKLFSIPQTNSYINTLKENDLIIEYGKDSYICTNFGKEYSTSENTDLIIEMISVALLPFLEKPLDYSSARKIELLISLYNKYQDKRITKILPFIEKTCCF